MRFSYRECGDPSGPPILFVHGGFASSRWWLPLFEVLPSEFHLIAPDLRGCGQSDRPADGYSIESQAADLAALIEALNLRDFDLVAHAAGAAIAMEYALTWPGSLRSLTLVDGASIEGVDTPREALAALAHMRTDTALLRSALAALAPGVAASDAAFFEEIVADAAGMAPAAFTEVTAALGAWNRSEEARGLTLPCLLIWGDADPLVSRETVTRTLLAIPGAANLEVLRGVGHCPMLDAPLALAERLVDFVTEDFAGLSDLRSQELHRVPGESP